MTTIPTWLYEWAQRIVNGGPEQPELEDASLMAPFVGIENECAEVIVRAVELGELEVSESADLDADQVESFVEELSREF